MTKRFFYIFGAVLLLLVFFQVAAAPAETGNLSQQDRIFIQKASMADKMEIKLGRVAIERANSKAVKEYAVSMVDNYSIHDKELQQIAKSNGMAFPDGLDAEQSATIQRLLAYSGSEFDRFYMDAMVQAHRQVLDIFKKEVNEGQNPALKQFAAKVAQTIEAHLQRAQNIHGELIAER